MKPLQIITVLITATLVACGGGNGALSTLPAPKVTQNVEILLRVPPRNQQSIARRPQYVSPATLGIGATLGASGTTSFSASQEQNPAAVADLSTCPVATCTLNADGSKSYMISFALAPGTYALDLVTWDAVPAAGAFTSTTAHELSKTIVPLSFAPGSAPVLAAFVLNGISSTVKLIPSASQTHVIPDGAGNDIIGSGPTYWSAMPFDSDGYIITGPGSPTLQLVDPTSALNIQQTAANSFTIQAATYAISPLPLTLTATSPGLPTASASPMISTIQELWIVDDFGSPPYAVYGYPLYTSATVPTGILDVIQGNPTTNFEGLAIDGSGNIWLSEGVSPYNVVEYSAPRNAVPALLNTATIITPPATTSQDNALGIDSVGHVIMADYGAKVIIVYPSSGGSTPTLTSTTTGSSGPESLAIAPASTGALADSIWYATGIGMGAFASAVNGLATVIITNPPSGFVQGVGFDPLGHLWITSNSGTGPSSITVYNVTSTSATSATLSSPLATLSGTPTLGSFSFGMSGTGDAWIPGQFVSANYYGYHLTCSSACTLSSIGTLTAASASAAQIAP